MFFRWSLGSKIFFQITTNKETYCLDELNSDGETVLSNNSPFLINQACATWKNEHDTIIIAMQLESFN